MKIENWILNTDGTYTVGFCINDESFTKTVNRFNFLKLQYEELEWEKNNTETKILALYN